MVTDETSIGWPLDKARYYECVHCLQLSVLLNPSVVSLQPATGA